MNHVADGNRPDQSCVPAEIQGEFCSLIDLEQLPAATAFLQKHHILPDDRGALADENIDLIHELSPATRDILVAFLDSTDPARAADVRRVLRLN